MSLPTEPSNRSEYFLFPFFVFLRPLEVSLSISFTEVAEDPALG